MYKYKAIVTKVYDGDTVTVDIDLGFHTWLKNVKVRLYGIDAPELRGAERVEGIKSRDRLRELVLNKEIILHTLKDKKGKYGRWLGIIHLSPSLTNVNNLLVIEDYAKTAHY